MQHSDQIVSARNELMALRNQLGRTIISPKSPRQLSPYNEGAQSFTSRSRSTFSMLQPNMSSVTAGTSPGSQRQETPIHAQGTYPGEDTRANFSWQLRAYQSDEKRRFEDAVREDAAHHIALKVEEAHQNISRKFCVDLDVEVQRIKEIEEENTRIATEAANRAFQQEIESLKSMLTRDVAEAQKNYDEWRETSRKDLDSTVARVREQCERQHQGEMQILKKTFQREREEAKKKHVRNIETLKAERDAAESNIRSHFFKEMEILKKNVQLEKQQQDIAHSRALQELRTECAEAETMKVRDLNGEIESLKAQLKDMTVLHQKERAAADTNYQNSTAEITSKHQEALLRLRSSVEREYENKIKLLEKSLACALETVSQVENEKIDALKKSAKDHELVMKSTMQQFADHMMSVTCEHDGAVQSLTKSLNEHLQLMRETQATNRNAAGRSLSIVEDQFKRLSEAQALMITQLEKEKIACENALNAAHKFQKEAEQKYETNVLQMEQELSILRKLNPTLDNIPNPDVRKEIFAIVGRFLREVGC